MTQAQIQNIFQQRYNHNTWKQFLGQAFLNARLLSKPEELSGINKDVALEAFKLGYISLNEEGIERQIAIYEVVLAKGIVLERNRVGLRNLLRKYWKNIDAAFIAYYNPENTNWRFTYVSELTGFDAEGELISIKTEPKRYTYILGEGETCRTAAERFALLVGKGSKVSLEDIKDAFSVEKLSKAFFDEYKSQYEDFVEFLTGKRIVKADGVWQEIQTHKPSPQLAFIFHGNEKAARDFCKKMLGRIVFLYFIQKKGWLGVPIKGDWGDGNKNFMPELFEKFRHKEIFYSELLTKLFFEALNTDRQDSIIELVSGEPCKIPYLNGGLFEEENPVYRKLIFPAQLFQRLFTFFNQYNFTIYEDDPNDHTIAVDPEMLGHIFENLLEDNKDKGAFYTPKEIVHYMCQESLIEYLTTWFEHRGYKITGYVSFDKPDQFQMFSVNDGRKGQMLLEYANKSSSKTISRVLIEKLLKKNLADNDKQEVLKHNNELQSALDSVRICDPAIGSGAFPMGLLHEIFAAKQTLHTFKYGNTIKFNASIEKLKIIQNSIYGVDIEKGAVDIARLRFWLSLIVDDTVPKPLPNLDFKIIVGNSLVSKLGDDIINIDWNLNERGFQTNIYGTANLQIQKLEILKRIVKEQKEYFNPESDKKKLSADIRNLKIDLLLNQLELMVKTKGIETKPTGNGKNVVKQTEIYLQTYGWKRSIEKLRVLKAKSNLPLNYFDWRLDFPEVMNEQVSDEIGFDIVIGNPPYISYYSNTGSELSIDMKKHIVSSFESVRKENDRINSMNLFSEQGLKLLRPYGFLTFIVNKTMAVLPSYEYYREYFLRKTTFKYILTDLTPFDAIVDCFIFGVTSERSEHPYFFKFFKGGIDTCSIESISIFQKNRKKEFHIPKDDSILDFIDKAPFHLGDILTINRGVNIGGCFDVFLNSEKENNNYKKYLSGTKCIKPYYWKWESEDGYMIFDIEEEKRLRAQGETIALGNHDRFTQTKLIIPESSQSIMAAYIEETIYTAYGLLVATTEYDKRYLKYACGLLNSKLITFYSIQREILRKGNKATPHVGVKGLRELPIYKDDKHVEKISNLVDNIITLKSEGKDSSLIEKKINNLVYKIYRMTYNDVIIIEPNFELNEKEYDSLNFS